MTEQLTPAQVTPAQVTPAQVTRDSGSPAARAGRAAAAAGRAVIPGGMYGHQSAGPLPPEYPQFMRSGRGARIWDVDGNEYVDLMCSYGPVVLGHQHPAVEAAARAQAELADCQNGPGEVMVELAELLVATVRHADWAMFAKNGTDATTICCTIARAHTGRSTHPGGDRRLPRRGAVVHAAAGGRHQRGPRQPRLLHVQRPGVGDGRRARRQAPDLAAIVVSPFKHDAGYDQELVDPAFARGLRELCTQTGAALILDDVRCGFRLHLGSSWEPIGVLPDLSAWSKAIANGHPLAAVLGSGRFRGRGGEHLRHRVVLVLGRRHGGGNRHDRRPARRRRHRGDGPGRDRAACRDPRAGEQPRDRDQLHRPGSDALPDVRR